MLKLIQLEWQKNNLSGYFKGLAVCIVAIFAAVTLMALGSQSENEPMSYTDFMSLSDILVRVTYIIFSSVILSRLVIDEYKSKDDASIVHLPVATKNHSSQINDCVWVLFFSIIITTFMINLLTYLLNPMIGLFDASIAVDAMMAAVPATALNAFMMAGISLIPLSFGMRKIGAFHDYFGSHYWFLD